jgi:hypothetical protein
MAWDRVWKSDGEFDHREDRMEPSKLRRLGEMVCSMSDTSFDGEGAYLMVRQFQQRSVSGNVASIEPDLIS